MSTKKIQNTKSVEKIDVNSRYLASTFYEISIFPIRISLASLILKSSRI